MARVTTPVPAAVSRTSCGLAAAIAAGEVARIGFEDQRDQAAVVHLGDRSGERACPSPPCGASVVTVRTACAIDSSRTRAAAIARSSPARRCNAAGRWIYHQNISIFAVHRTSAGAQPMRRKADAREGLRRHPRHLCVRRRPLAPRLSPQHVLHVADEGGEPQGVQGRTRRNISTSAFRSSRPSSARRSSSANTTGCWSSAATSISPPSSAPPTAIRSSISPR